MQIVLSIRDHDGLDHDVAVTADRQTRFADVAALLPDRFSSNRTSMFSDGEPLSENAELGGPGLRTGCVISVHATSRRPASSILQLRVCSGPDAGGVIPLTRGVRTIGRSAPADIVVDDPDVSRRHAELTVDATGVFLRDLESANGTTVNSVAVGATFRRVDPADYIRVGDSLLQVVAAGEPPAAVHPTEDGLVLVNRPPVVPGDPVTPVVEFPVAEIVTERPKVQWLAALLPAVLAVALAMFLHNVEFLAFALLSPITLAAQTVADRRDHRRRSAAGAAAWASAEAAAREELDRCLGAERRLRHRSGPDAAAVLQSVSTPDHRLWERRIGTTDFLLLRLGIGDLPAHTSAIRGTRPVPIEPLADLPAVVDVKLGGLGIAGPVPVVRAVARWLIAQALAVHSPSDLQLVALLGDDLEEWRWLRWAGAALASVATTDAQRRRIIDELVEEVELRRGGHHPRAGQAWSGSWLLVLIDPAGTVATLGGLQTLLLHGPEVGVTVICTDQTRALLPMQCHSIATVTGETGTRLDVAVSGAHPIPNVVGDGVSVRWADRFVRALAPLRDAETATGVALPADVALVELVNLRTPTPEGVLDRWNSHGGAAAPIGMSASGVLELDLVRDGPHALIAGTTGSGKSELLRSLVLGLAASHAPADVSFVLIDYKGGAAFSGCADLPHTLGVVTDLDSQVTSRVLTSLDAEVRRREAAFAEAGVFDLSTYRSSPAGAGRPLSRLILVVDEFATLAEELPSFLSGLVSIAQRGRSLGLHLVLATQRPAGVLSPEIKANMSIRIALRVTDPGESSDVIASDAASSISRRHPGRAIARLGDGLVQFQVARVGLPLRPDGAVEVRELGPWHEPSTRDSAYADDDLPVLLGAIAGAHRASGRPVPNPPWLPALAAPVVVDALPAPRTGFDVAFGLVDDPTRQAQYAVVHDLDQGGSIGFAGGPRSGRSTVLRTVCGRAAAQLDASRLHLYVIDCAGHSLRDLGELPHTGAVLDSDDPVSVAALLARLVAEMTRRQKLLAEHGVASLAEARRAGVELPAIIVAVDGWEGFTALSEDFDAGRSSESLLHLLRDSAAVGMTFLVTGDRSLLGIRIGSVLQRRFLLRLTDRGDYATAGLHPGAVPERFRPGQAVTAEDGLEVQFALLTEDPGAAAQSAAVRASARRERSDDTAQIRVRPLPREVLRTELGDPVTPPRCLLGLGGDDAQPVAEDLFAGGSRFLIAGPARSGRTTMALLIAQQALESDLRILVAAPPRSALTAWAVQHGLEPHPPSSAGAPEQNSHDLVLIDDAEQFTDTDIGLRIEKLVADSPAAVVCAARTDDLMLTYRGIAAEVRRHRTGLLLQPGPADGDLLGIRIAVARSPLPAGRGLLVTDGSRSLGAAALMIQVAR